MSKTLNYLDQKSVQALCLDGVGVFSLSDPCNADVIDLLAQSSNAKMRLKRKQPQKFVNVLPGFYSGDVKFMRMLEDLCRKLNDEVAAPPVDCFADDGGVAGDFDRLRTISGTGGTPAGQTLHSNHSFRERVLKLPNRDPNDEELMLFKSLCKVMFSKYVVTPLKVASKSSSGFPFCTFEKEEKIKTFLNLIQAGQWDRFHSLISKNDGVALAKEFGVCFVYLQNFRYSPDTFGKVRRVPSLKAACNPIFEDSELLVMDKSIQVNGSTRHTVQSNRSRLVMGMNNAVNLAIALFNKGVSKYYLNRYAYTWKHKGKEHSCAKLNEHKITYPRGVVRAQDIAQFDLSVCQWMREEFVTNLLDLGLISERYVLLMRKSLFASVCLPDVGDGVGPMLHGDFRKLETLISPGLLSGIDTVSTEGKLYVVWQNLILINHTEVALGKKKLITCEEDIESFLDGKLSYRLLNQGDDGLMMYPSIEAMQMYFSETVMKHSFLAISMESVTSFLGDTYSYNPNTLYSAANSIPSHPQKTFCPERAFGGMFRKYWYIGVEEREFVYSKGNPKWGIYKDVLNWGVRKHYTHSFDDMRSHWKDSNPSFNASDQSYADRLFREDSNVIHWKIDEDDVSQHLLDAEFENIPTYAFMHILESDIHCEQVAKPEMTYSYENLLN